MAMNLPPQNPQRRTVGLRPRNDRPWLPRFPEPTRREYAHPIETYDPTNEPRDFGWAELRDPSVWVGGGVMFAAFVVLLIVFLSSGPTPS